MISNFIKYIFIISGLSPILLSLWFVKTIQNFHNLSFYLEYESINKIRIGLIEFAESNYLLLIFVGLVFLNNYLLKKAIYTLSVGEVKLKSIKSADFNFSPVMISYFLPWFKFLNTNLADTVWLIGSLLIYLVFIIIWKNSYHFNLIFRLFFGYRFYEIQTKNEIGYLLLSKQKLINTNQVNKYIQLTDYMIINIK